MVISAQIHRLAEQELPFQRLTIDTDTALAMFEENPYKTGQIPNIADKRGKLTVYKVGPHSIATLIQRSQPPIFWADISTKSE